MFARADRVNGWRRSRVSTYVRRLVLSLALSLALIPTLAFATVPVVQGVVDSAGYGPRMAPGSLASLFGTNLSSTTASASTFPLPTAMAGATVSVGGVAAALFYVSPTQINFQVPSATKTGTATVTVNGPGGTSASFSFTVTAQAPSIYQYGTNHAVATNVDGSVNSDSAPAAAGSVITVYLTGLGAVSNPVTDGTAAPLSPLSSASAASTATIGALSAPIQFLGLTPDLAAVGQANIQVPTLPSGDYPLVLTVGGRQSQSAVVSVAGSGTAYTSLLSFTSSAAFTNSQTSSVVLFDNIAYVCGANRIVMVNVSNVASPTVIGEFGDSILSGGGGNCAINAAGTVPFLVDIVQGSSTSSPCPEISSTVPQSCFAVFNLSTPSAPTTLTLATTSYSYMQNLTFSGNYGIVTTSYLTYNTSNDAVEKQEGDFLVYDFTNSANGSTTAGPAFLAAMQPSSLAGSGNANLKPYSTVVDQTYTYVASSTATGTTTSGGQGFLDVINIASPTAPSPISVVTVRRRIFC